MAKGKTRPQNPRKRKPKQKQKNKVNYKTNFPLYGDGHDMKSCKLIKAQNTSMKATCLSACGGGGRGKFPGAKKIPAKVKDLNTLVALGVTKAMKKENIKTKI